MGRPRKLDSEKSIATINAEIRRETRRQKKLEEIKTREWYKLNSILGYWWAIFLFLLSVGVKLVNLMLLLTASVINGESMVVHLYG